MRSVGHLQAETVGRPGLFGSWILCLKVLKSITDVLKVAMVRFCAVAGTSYMVSLKVFRLSIVRY